MIEQISPKEAVKELREGAFLLDVREASELVVSKIEGSYHIPMNDVESRLDEIPKDTVVIVQCRSGGRSQQIALVLETKGYTAKNLVGGINLWADEVDPTIVKY